MLCMHNQFSRFCSDYYIYYGSLPDVAYVTTGLIVSIVTAGRYESSFNLDITGSMWSEPSVLLWQQSSHSHSKAEVAVFLKCHIMLYSMPLEVTDHDGK